MGDVSAEAVKALRERTGAGMMDCKKALAEAKGDAEVAVEILRKMGLKDIAKRSGKVAAEGTIGVYSHGEDQIVSIVELNCETDFVARGKDFRELARGIAMHVAAMRPLYVSETEVPAAVLEKEKEIALAALAEDQRSKADKILPGKLKKYFEEVCLLNQMYVKDDSGKKSVQDAINDVSVQVGEKVTLRRFARYEVGEGIEKQVANLEAEVAATIGGN